MPWANCTSPFGSPSGTTVATDSASPSCSDEIVKFSTFAIPTPPFASTHRSFLPFRRGFSRRSIRIPRPHPIRQLSDVAQAVVPHAVGEEFDDAVILVVHASGVVLDVSVVPQHLPVGAIRVNHRPSRQAYALKPRFIREVQAGRAIAHRALDVAGRGVRRDQVSADSPASCAEHAADRRANSFVEEPKAGKRRSADEFRILVHGRGASLPQNG